MTRNHGKSSILFGVILILGNVIAGAIAVNQSTQNVEKQIKAQLGSLSTIGFDYEQVSSEDNGEFEFTPLPEELIKQIGERPEVKQFDYLRETDIAVDKFEPFSFTNDNDNALFSITSERIYLTGTNLLKPLEFENDGVNLIEGRFFNEEEQRMGKYVGLISSELAQKNGIRVGDTMVLDGQFEHFTSDGSSEKKKGNDYSIEVVGIFKNTSLEQANNNEQESGNNSFSLDDRPFNQVYLPNEAVKNISEDERSGLQKAFPSDEILEESEFFTPQYILFQPEDAEIFKQEVTPMLPPGYKVHASTDEYDRVGSSMNRLSQISSYVVIIAIIASLIIISLIIVLFTRDRKYELGIYLSLGERKKYVFAQIVIELLLIGVIAMLISLITGNLLGRIVSDSLLSSSLLESNQTPLDFSYNIPIIDQSMINDAFTVQYTISYVVIFLITGIVTILLSAVLPLLYILRLNPKKIML